jgi:hypothetical protein
MLLLMPHGILNQRTSYDFANGQSLALNNVDFVQLTKKKWMSFHSG